MSLPARPALRAAAAVAAAGAACAGYAVGVERHAFALRRVTVPVLPAGALPLRVLHISDLHLVPGQRRKQEWVAGLAALEPDLVVDTGDNLADLRAVPLVLEALRDLLEVPGAFVLGSNDYYAPAPRNPLVYLGDFVYSEDELARRAELPWPEMVDAFTAAGWVDLTHRRAVLEIEGVPLELVGVDDPHLGRDDYGQVAGPPHPATALTIGVSHAPYQRVLDAMTADGAGLVLAGHTHGGQLCVPGYGALTTNCDLDRRRVKGLSRWWPGAGSTDSAHAPADAAWLHVSAGVGTARFAPARFACRPEATLLTLTPAA